MLVCGLALAACGGTKDGRDPEWAYIAPVLLRPNCATTSCHSRAAAVAGLDFSDSDRAYTSLTGLRVGIHDPGASGLNCLPEGQTVVCQREHRPLVTPYNPSQSRLVAMLRARGASRMPPDRPLPEPDIELIEAWILAGAWKQAPALGQVLDAGRVVGAMDSPGDAAVPKPDGSTGSVPVAESRDASSQATPDGSAR